MENLLVDNLIVSGLFTIRMRPPHPSEANCPGLALKTSILLKYCNSSIFVGVWELNQVICQKIRTFKQEKTMLMILIINKDTIEGTYKRQQQAS